MPAEQFILKALYEALLNALADAATKNFPDLRELVDLDELKTVLGIYGDVWPNGIQERQS